MFDTSRCAYCGQRMLGNGTWCSEGCKEADQRAEEVE